MRVRRFAAQDAEAVAALLRRSVEQLGLRDYSPEQVAAWAARMPDAQALTARVGDGRAAWVATDDADRAVAFADLEGDGHIDLLYCAPEAAGTGAAAMLYDVLEAQAREQGMERLYAEASEAALRFFVKRGFAMLHRRELNIGGVGIHNYAVEKRLD